ncbi:MAG: cation diffusion facilitator family transporter [Nitriliruptorales bacterium]|nr:cation diffusion facilitator family transporter [Nitriliruptorales bacterium]
MAGGGSRKAVLAALVANLGIAIAKFVGFLLTRSSSMLAESVHSVADSANQALLLLGGARARQRATREHPFGYGRERYFWAFVVTVVLFALGSLFALYEGLQKLREAHEVTSPGIAVGILVVAIVIESLSLRVAVREANAERGEASWSTFVRRSKNPELPVVLLEDVGAEVGLFLALGGVGLSLLTGDPVWDAAATVAIGILLGVIATLLSIEMKSLLIGEGASEADVAAIRAAMRSTPGVRQLIHLKTQHLGPEELLVAAKLALDPSLSFPEVAATINAAEERVRAQVPAARVMYIEPDVLARASTGAAVT